MNIISIICCLFFLLTLEVAIFGIIFSSKNKLATKITKYLMKTQKIKAVLTIEEVDQRILELTKKDD